MSSSEEVKLLLAHREEKKALQAKIQKMKHSINKGNKKNKKEVTNEIAKLQAELEIKHEKELKDLEINAHGHPNGYCKENISNGAFIENNHIANNSHLNENVVNDHSSTKDLTEDNSNNCLNEDINHLAEENSNQNLCEDILSSSINKNKSSFPVFTYKNVETNLKLTRAQKRRNKKENLAKEKEKFIKEQEEEMTQLSGARIQELDSLNEKLNCRNLMIHEIPSDGDCLYRAVQHQLSLLNVQKVMSMDMLRQLTAEHLLTNKEEYIPFLTNPLSGEIMSEEEFKNYCNQVANHHAWGGHVEVQALSRICGFPIEVIQADGPSVIAGDENLNPKLLLSYHRHAYNLGAHYNSLVPSI